MKEVLFKKISIKNFLSIGTEPVEILFEPGINIITGINKDKEDGKNGVGKSTITDAIFFALFGNTLRPINKDNIPNWTNKKDCCVSIEFKTTENGITTEYILTRRLSPSKVSLTANGEDISRTISKTTDNISDIIGTAPALFEQSVIMCLNQHEPFLSKTPAVKRKFIEDIFNIEIFSKMLQAIRSDYNKTKQLFDAENDKIIEYTSNINTHKKYAEEFARKKANIMQDLIARKQRAQEELSELEVKLVDNKKQIQQFNGTDLTTKAQAIRANIQKARQFEIDRNKQQAVLTTTIANLKTKIAETEKVVDGVCIYCNQPFSEDNKNAKRTLIIQYTEQIKSITDQLSIISSELKENTQNQQKDQDELESIQAQERQLNNLLQKDKEIQTEINNQKKWLTSYEKDIETQNTVSIDSTTSLIDDLTTRKNALTITVEDYKKQLAVQDTCKFIVSEEGVKNCIIKKMLKLLNNRLNYYLKQLDANCCCVFDEYFQETITTSRGRVCSYFNFSGGERKRIDLAMLFTFMDIRRAQSNIWINFSMYDELLDTSLDDKGIESVISVLKDRAKSNNEAIYIISHKSEAAKHATRDIIYLEKENDITKRKQYEYNIPTNPD